MPGPMHPIANESLFLPEQPVPAISTNDFGPMAKKSKFPRTVGALRPKNCHLIGTALGSNG